MTTINVIPSWTVDNVMEDQVFYGTVYPNAVYKFTTLDEDGKVCNTITTVKNVIPVMDADGKITDYKLALGVEFFENGFKNYDHDDVFILVSNIDEVEREYIKFETYDRDNRPQSSDSEAFKFNLMNTKTGKPFTIMVDHDHFVGIPATTKRGDVHTNYGYIDHVNTDENGKVTRIIMRGILSSHGVFRAARTVIPYAAVRGVYHYHIVAEPHKTKAAIDAPSATTAE